MPQDKPKGDLKKPGESKNKPMSGPKSPPQKPSGKPPVR